MDIEQVITDYIQRSILTTRGDMVTRGVGVPERLASVAVGQVLKSAGVGVQPAWGVPTVGENGLAIGNISRSSTGDEVVTGVGFQPSLVCFLANDLIAGNKNASVGFDIATACIDIYFEAGGALIASSVAHSILIRRDAGNNISGLITAVGGDGFTVTFTVTGACDARIKWLAIG